MGAWVRWFGILVLGSVLVACGSVTGPGDEGAAGGGDVIPGQYIVTLAQPGLSALSARDFEVVASRVAADHRATPGRPLRLINGFVATDLDADDVAALRLDARVADVEPDRVVTVQATQANPVWNLDRLDQRALPLDRSFSYGPSGAGVTAYVVDTGIRSTHTEFGGRVLPGFTVFDDGVGAEDCHGHGTHVAGTVGGVTYGVAKSVSLVAVRVLSCTGSGSTSGVIAGLDWIASHRSGPAVANMSLGGGASSALDTAVRNLVTSGVTVAVAAGNANADACNYSPARVGEAITAGATTNTDARASYSNYGTCVDLFAPGSGVTSAVPTSDTSTGSKSGTSMASPHVAGVVALVLESVPSATPAQVFTRVLEVATAGVVTGVGSGSSNRLLFADPAMASAPAPGTGPAPEPEPEPEPEPDPEPAPPAGPPCAGCDLYAGTLAGAGDAATWPNPDGSGYVTTARSGLHQGWLRGPAGAGFDLLLERWNGRRWVTVASATGAGADEEVQYVGKAATYRWRVVSALGAGAYELYLSLP